MFSVFWLSVFVLRFSGLACLTVCLAFGPRLSVFGSRLPKRSSCSCLLIGLRPSVFAFGFRALNPTMPQTLRIMSRYLWPIGQHCLLFGSVAAQQGLRFFFPFANSALRGPAVCWCCIWTSVFPRVKGISGCARVSANKVSDILCISGVTEISESAGSNVAETS